MEKKAAILILFAWPLLCSFQQNAAPKSGKSNQEGANGGQTNTDANKQARVKSVPAAPASDSTNKDGERNEANNNQNVNIAAREKSVDSVERVVSILGAVCTLALTIVGIIGVCVGIRTLKALRIQALIMRRQTAHIARQARSMRYQTTHLRNSVGALINSERAWVMLEEITPAWDHLSGLIVQRNFPVQIELLFKNFGRTPAWVVGHSFTFSLENKDFQPPEQYQSPSESSFGRPLPPEPQPNWSPSIVKVRMQPEQFSGEQLTSVLAGDKIIVLRGYVAYRDSFTNVGKPLPTTSLCLKFVLQTDGKRSFWLYFGEKANSHT